MGQLKKYLIGLFVLLIVGILAIAGKYLDLLWYQSMGATRVFWLTLITGPVTKITLGILITAFFLANVWIALKVPARFADEHLWFPEISRNALLLSGAGISLVLAFLLSTGLSMDWTVIQQFLHPQKTGITDPAFHKDLGFYLFTYPFFKSLYTLIITTSFLGLAGSAAIYLLNGAFFRQGTGWDMPFSAKVHLSVLASLFLIVKIWGYGLNRYGLLFQESARMTGINYTAAHANLWVLQLLTWVVIALIGIVWLNLFRSNLRLVAAGFAGWLIISFGMGVFYPGIIQSLVVKPNEYELESAYLKRHIQFTRQAYGLDRVKLEDYNPYENQTVQLKTDSPVFTDLRLWDYRPLQSSYNQLQSIRPYYHFTDVDIDRYPSTTGQSQVMLSARELVADNLPAAAKASWINLHLTYTHGYGFAANQVNQFSAQGQPLFISKDLPPKTEPDFPTLKVSRPEIYFGEKADTYAIVKSRTPEFDYPKGDGNTSTIYKANTGIGLDSFGVKLLLALKYHESNFILSSQLTKKSRILMYRNIMDRARKLAPFLLFDNDPYLVVARGKLYWIIDAYTISAYYPYSRYHEQGFNYIRNSVKTVIDAYDGSVNFYLTDPQDPVIRVWQKIFPGMFKPVRTAAPEIARHFRYPEDIMTIQRDMLTQYHMTDSKTFYAQEDNWDIPVYNTNERFEPYYVTLVLPGEKNDEFNLMQPFSPRNKQNLSSWLIARCDAPRYGELRLYRLPKDQNIYGPAQIDSRINQDQTISQLVTLWNQNQSRVIWGNLLIIPVDNAILYVKPLFIESEQSQQAELKKVVMVFQNQVVLGDTVADALSRLSSVATTPETGKTAQAETSRPGPEERKAAILQRMQQLSKELQQLTGELGNLEKQAP